MADPHQQRRSIREHLGVWLKDRWRWERALRSQSQRYLRLCNRYEALQPAPQGEGQACLWRYTSRLHAAMVQPQLARRLLRRCLQDAPIRLAAAPQAPCPNPQISVLIGHRGLQRLPLLLATLESLAAQVDVSLECLVIEQDEVAQIAAALPDWVRHIHAPLAEPGAPYNRSQTFNVGASAARAPVLLLHDNDLLVPVGYAARILERISQGYAVVNPKRFIFYLSQAHSQALLDEAAGFDAAPAESIMQNAEAGGSLAIKADTFAELGGMDEAFSGWGGEDNEFWDRCRTRPCWIWGYEPIVHLWHASQPLKEAAANPNLERAKALMALPAEERIRRLRQRRLASQA